MRRIAEFAAATLVFVACTVHAVDAVPAAVVPPASAKPQTPIAKLFIKPVVFRGTLDGVAVQVRLAVKEDFAEGLEGEYFRFGRPQKILLAGEMDPDGIFIEESENGTDVSGQWEGKLEGDVIRGTWTSPDGDITKPFVLTVLNKKSSPIAARPVAGKATKTTSN